MQTEHSRRSYSSHALSNIWENFDLIQSFGCTSLAAGSHVRHQNSVPGRKCLQMSQTCGFWWKLLMIIHYLLSSLLVYFMPVHSVLVPLLCWIINLQQDNTQELDQPVRKSQQSITLPWDVMHAPAPLPPILKREKCAYSCHTNVAPQPSLHGTAKTTRAIAELDKRWHD